MKYMPILLKGFTLMELIVAVSVVSILLVIGIPSYQMLFASNSLKGGASSLYSMLNLSKTESIKRNNTIFLKITTGENWCVGSNEGDAVCDCNTKESCITSVSHNRYKNLTLVSDYSAPFYDRIGNRFNEPSKSFTLKSLVGNEEVHLNVNMLGLVRMCGVNGVLGLNKC